MSLPSPLSPTTDLNKHRRYEIRMTVYNAVGEGPLSAPQEVFVGEAGECRCPRAPARLPRPHEAQPISFSSLEAPAPHTHLPSCPPVPTMAPRNVAVHGPTATQLDVTWEPPPLESQNGDIQGYKVWALQRPDWGLGVTHSRWWKRPPGLHLLFVHSPQDYRVAGTKVPPPVHVLGHRNSGLALPAPQRQHQIHAKQLFGQPSLH